MQKRTQLKRILMGELGASLRVPAASLIEQVACQSIIVAGYGLTLMNVSFYWQLVIKGSVIGSVIILAVTVDKLRTRGEIH